MESYKPIAPVSRLSAVLATLGVVFLAFFPAPVGSFQATHGPTSALRALAAAVRLFLIIAMLPVSAWLRSEVGRTSFVVDQASGESASPQLLALRC